ncbi:MAG: efflux RND transporter periplasmic adaptor subunit [Oceanicaulis sp.]
MGRWLAARGGDEASNAAPPAHISVEPVTRGSIIDIVPAIGTIRSASQVEVGAEVSGRIVEIGGDFDDAVAAGDLLARIDPAPFEAAVARAQASLAASEAALAEADARAELARQQSDRAARLADTGAGRSASADDARLTVVQLEAGAAQARARVALSRSQLREAEINLNRTRVTAPIDGFVLDRRIEVGQTVNAALSAPTLFVIAADLSSVIIEAQVAEADVGRITPDMTVRFKVDAYPAERFQGVASPVRRSPRVEGRFVTYPVLIRAEDPEQRLLPGMTASVEFVGAEAFDVLRAPRAALYVPPPDPIVLEDWFIERQQRAGTELEPPYDSLERAAINGSAIAIGWQMGEMDSIYIWRNGAGAIRFARIGREDAEYFEIVDGTLEEGDLVVVRNRDPEIWP